MTSLVVLNNLPYTKNRQAKIINKGPQLFFRICLPLIYAGGEDDLRLYPPCHRSCSLLAESKTYIYMYIKFKLNLFKI